MLNKMLRNVACAIAEYRNSWKLVSYEMDYNEYVERQKTIDALRNGELEKINKV